MATCAVCGAELTPSETGRPSIYCSTSCRVRGHRQRHGIGSGKQVIPRDKSRTCLQCGTAFRLAKTGRPRLYCSGNCRSLAFAEKRRVHPPAPAQATPERRTVPPKKKAVLQSPPKRIKTERNDTKRPASSSSTPSLATAAFGKIDDRERKLRAERNELGLYLELLGLAGATLSDVVHQDLVKHAGPLQAWAKGRGAVGSRPRGLRPILQWLRTDGRDHAPLHEALRDPMLQAAAVKLYRAYRKTQMEQPAESRMRAGKRRRATWDEVDAAGVICTELHGTGGPPRYLRDATQHLSEWRKAPKRHPLPPRILQALLPMVTGLAAHQGRRSLM